MRKKIETYTTEDYKKHFENKPKKIVQKKESEHEIQASFVKRFRLLYPSILMFAIPNGGKRHIITAINIKKEGQLPGVPDIFIAQSNGKKNGLFLEFKNKSGKLTENQDFVINKLLFANYEVFIVRSVTEAIKCYETYIKV